jgi:hypothetical protein
MMMMLSVKGMNTQIRFGGDRPVFAANSPAGLKPHWGCDYAGLMDLSSELSCVTPQGMWETSVSPIRRKEAVSSAGSADRSPICSVKRKASM